MGVVQIHEDLEVETSKLPEARETELTRTQLVEF